MRVKARVLLALCLTFATGNPGYCDWGQPLPQSKADESPVELRPPSPTPASSPSTKGGVSVNADKSADTDKIKTSHLHLEKIRRDKWIAWRMAKDPWIDRACLAEPGLVEAICAHPGPAKLLAKHPHIEAISEADPYLCRRLTQWRHATMNLVRNPHCGPVITRDPEGIYRAVQKRPKVGRILAKNVMFQQMIVDNPDLGRFLAGHM